MVASFTKAASEELASRDLPINPKSVGTLHSHCYRAVGARAITDGDKALIAEWNKRYPYLALSAQQNVEDLIEFGGVTEGDQIYALVQLYRSRLIPLDRWLRPDARSFYKLWSEFKRATDSLDFTDLIEIALRDCDTAPGNPRFGFFDEVQDFTPLQLALVRKWGAQMENIVLAGDDDQAIYGWLGATPDAFLDPPLPEEQIRVLGQSYRLPFEVQRYAQRWIEGVSRRQEKPYAPRGDDPGEVRFIGFDLNNAPLMVKDIERHVLARGDSAMILTSCSAMLNPFKRALREAGVPFENRFRRKRGDWNPLYVSNGMSTAQRLLAYLAPAPRGSDTAWSMDELRRWGKMVRAADVFKRGVKSNLETGAGTEPLRTDYLSTLFQPEALARALQYDPPWLKSVADGSYAEKLAYPVEIRKRYGDQALLDAPHVTIGTIHSVKGGEADHVYLLPDLSWPAYDAYTRPDGQDSVIRQFYVGMTRARKSLTVGTALSGYAVRLPRQMPTLHEVTL